MQFVQCIALLHNALRRQMVGIRPLPWVLLGLPCPPSMIGPHKSWMISNFPIQILFRVGSIENVIWGKFSQGLLNGNMSKYVEIGCEWWTVISNSGVSLLTLSADSFASQEHPGHICQYILEETRMSLVPWSGLILNSWWTKIRFGSQVIFEPSLLPCFCCPRSMGRIYNQHWLGSQAGSCGLICSLATLELLVGLLAIVLGFILGCLLLKLDKIIFWSSLHRYICFS